MHSFLHMSRVAMQLLLPTESQSEAAPGSEGAPAPQALLRSVLALEADDVAWITSEAPQEGAGVGREGEKLVVLGPKGGFLHLYNGNGQLINKGATMPQPALRCWSCPPSLTAGALRPKDAQTPTGMLLHAAFVAAREAYKVMTAAAENVTAVTAVATAKLAGEEGAALVANSGDGSAEAEAVEADDPPPLDQWASLRQAGVSEVLRETAAAVASAPQSALVVIRYSGLKSPMINAQNPRALVSVAFCSPSRCHSAGPSQPASVLTRCWSWNVLTVCGIVASCTGSATGGTSDRHHLPALRCRHLALSLGCALHPLHPAGSSGARAEAGSSVWRQHNDRPAHLSSSPGALRGSGTSALHIGFWHR